MLLIVDDHDDTRIVLTRLLKLDGYETVAVACGKAALQFLETHIPRLILLDYSMPDMDGISVLRQIKTDPRLARIPIVMFSAFDQPYRQIALREGVDAYVIKGTLDWANVQREIARLAGPGKPMPDLAPAPSGPANLREA